MDTAGSMGQRGNPTLVVNPADDGLFASFAQVLVDHGAISTEELERRLRTVYPFAAVHARQLSAEVGVVWYVYRDGHWIDARHVAARAVAMEQDARPSRGSPVD
jgi:hypothetical protein